MLLNQTANASLRQQSFWKSQTVIRTFVWNVSQSQFPYKAVNLAVSIGK